MAQSSADCIFCKIVAGAIPCFKLHEDDRTIAFLDINPANPGHTLVVPKAHAPTLAESEDADLAAVLPVAKRLAAAIASVVEPDGINLVQANGPGAAQSVLHFHLHIVPRRTGDELAMNWALKPGEKSDLAALADKIRGALGR